ncbi:CHAT domain-containing protein [Burkholderia gladioli]|uniref:CHAT domain-containing protein n=1 Tax=Burkholderia gladioli TaxID=28095 RepID=UPI003F78DE1B
MKSVRVTWKASKWWRLKRDRLGIRPADGEPFEMSRIGKLPKRDKVELRSNSARSSIVQALNAYEGFEARLVEVLYEGASPCVIFDLGEGPVYVPWEAALLNSRSEKIRNSYVPVRVRGGQLDAPAVLPSNQLRVLILLGDPGEIGNEIDPSSEAEGILAAWTNLDPLYRARIARPEVVQLAGFDLKARLSRDPVDILWYCGHGQVDPESALLSAPRVWMSIKDFAMLIPEEHAPLCCVFWACDLGRASKNEVVSAPDVHDALVKQGVKITLAMQSRIQDRVARDMAIAYFEGLATGMSFEKAAAHSRLRGEEVAINLDWAAPVLWSTLTPAHSLSWPTPVEPTLADRFLAGATVRAIQKLPDVQSLEFRYALLANRWQAAQRLVVEADFATEATAIALAKVARAATEVFELTPIFVKFQGNDWRTSVVDWATSMLNRLAPNMAESDLHLAIEIACKQPEEGLRRLMQIERALLVLLASQAAAISDELVEYVAEVSLDSAESSTVVLMSPIPPESGALSDWERHSFEHWVLAADPIEITAYMESDFETLAAMAVLDLPFSDRELETLGFSRKKYPQDSGLFLEGESGPVLTAPVRRLVLDRVDKEQLRDAHQRCLAFLGRQATVSAERLDLERLRHLVALDEYAEALEVAGSLIDRFGLSDRDASVIDCFLRLSPLGDRKMDLQPYQLLYVARAYIRQNQVHRANLILQRSMPREPLELALHHALRSEVAKNSGATGWREEALNEIDAAIDLCRHQAANGDYGIARDAEHDLAHWEMNRARLLQYLFYDTTAAATTYERILAQPANRYEPLLLATAKRNLVGCLLSHQSIDASTIHRAERELREAEALLEAARSRDLLIAELAYERAKLAELNDAGQSRRAELLSVCIECAHDIGNGMVEAIAMARLFWLEGQFESQRWERIDRRLLRYRRHGWALRTLINGRVRAARFLADEGNIISALDLLRRSKAELDARPGFDRGTDRRRIAEVMGGIAQLSEDEIERRRASERAYSHVWMSQWLDEHGFETIEAAWRRAD